MPYSSVAIRALARSPTRVGCGSADAGHAVGSCASLGGAAADAESQTHRRERIAASRKEERKIMGELQGAEECRHRQGDRGTLVSARAALARDHYEDGGDCFFRSLLLSLYQQRGGRMRPCDSACIGSAGAVTAEVRAADRQGPATKGSCTHAVA
mmetsp:Transcript_11245/g.46938  ORF Transcript_11245/g.46938 Transcript_11245/m.46938 type:complete len:155 (+) Transcript_11245:2673-3137(+)